MYARQLTFKFELYVTSVAVCQSMMQRQWRLRWCCPGLITATRSCTANLRPSSTNYSNCWKLFTGLPVYHSTSLV